jgi:hypothetical protein
MTHQPITFEDIWAEARARTPHLTDAEFSYSLAFDDHRNARGELANAAYVLATQDLPEVTTETPAAELTKRALAAHILVEMTGPQRAVAIGLARRRRYTGWSDAARGLGKRIEYAETHVTVRYDCGTDAYRVETFKAGDSTPERVLSGAQMSETYARVVAQRMALEEGLIFFEWAGEAP